jgi:hypothetical protein
MDCIPEIQVVSHRRGVSGIVGHVMSIADLAGATMAASVVSDNPVAFAEEEQHLVIPIVGRERPPMMKDDRLRVLGTPILVENFDAVFGGDESHGDAPFTLWVVKRYRFTVCPSVLGDGPLSGRWPLESNLAS